MKIEITLSKEESYNLIYWLRLRYNKNRKVAASTLFKLAAEEIAREESCNSPQKTLPRI